MTNELKKAIEIVKAYLDMDSDVDSEYLNAQRTIIQALEQQRWIPVSERLPELGKKVLCQCQANIYEVLKLTVDGWYYNPNHCYMESFVIAWMPLPEPYKAECKIEQALAYADQDTLMSAT